MYEFTDKAIDRINRTIQHEFSILRRTILAFDEINVIRDAVNGCYGAILSECKKIYLEVANNAYKAVTERDSMFTVLWIEQFLLDYDPVTKYVFAHEFDRKRARTFEAVVATKKHADVAKELKQAMYNLAVQTKQYADEVTDTATLEGYVDSGISRVRWITEGDGRVCGECRARENKIYPVDKVPDKPHIRCRCYLLPVTDRH